MALPQQGTETTKKKTFAKKNKGSVNGLTPTGDGNSSHRNRLPPKRLTVLMALPQQGTETLWMCM